MAVMTGANVPLLNAAFDLVLTDLDMPDMDGWGLTSCIKEKVA